MFSEYRSFVSLGRFIPRYFILFDAMINGVVSFFSFFFLGPHPWHMEFPRLGVESGLQLLVYTSHSNARSELHLETYTAAHGNIGSLTP